MVELVLIKEGLSEMRAFLTHPGHFDCITTNFAPPEEGMSFSSVPS